MNPSHWNYSVCRYIRFYAVSIKVGRLSRETSSFSTAGTFWSVTLELERQIKSGFVMKNQPQIEWHSNFAPMSVTDIIKLFRVSDYAIGILSMSCEMSVFRLSAATCYGKYR